MRLFMKVVVLTYKLCPNYYEFLILMGLLQRHQLLVLTEKLSQISCIIYRKNDTFREWKSREKML